MAVHLGSMTLIMTVGICKSENIRATLICSKLVTVLNFASENDHLLTVGAVASEGVCLNAVKVIGRVNPTIQ